MKIKEILDKKWEAHEEPILIPGKSGEWDDFGAVTASVFKNPQDDSYCMYYIGQSYASRNWGIGLATSIDLINWKKYPKNPLIIHKNSRDTMIMDGPFFFTEGGGKYHIICEEKIIKRTTLQPLKNLLRILFPFELRKRIWQIRRGLRKSSLNFSASGEHAKDRTLIMFTSNSPTEWDMHSKIEIFKKSDNQADFDYDGVYAPIILKIGERYNLIYTGSNGIITKTGLAVSSDLKNWERKGCILPNGQKGDWDEYAVSIVTIIKLDDGYLALYEGEDKNNNDRIGIAYSKDLLSWEKYKNNPILGLGKKGSFNELMTCGPHIFEAGGKFYIFFTGHDIDGKGYCGMASLKD
jgi:predicted GH43/DUF377 family glycosyl hydrolase